jgi:hypothetical protein
MISCGNKNARKENRIVYSLQTNKFDNLVLSIESKDSIIDYKYDSNDSIKNLSFRFYINKDVLVGDDVYFFKESTIDLMNNKFKIYGFGEGKGAVSHPRYIIFNNDYGLFGNITFGANFLFLKDSLSQKRSKLLFDKIILKLNDQI